MRRVLLGIGSLAILAGVIILYINSTASAAPGAQQKPSGSSTQKAGGQALQTGGRVVNTVQASDGKVRLTFTYSGSVQPKMQLNLAPRSSGRLDQILVDVGSEVKQGDPIAILERTSLELSVQQAEANLRSAEARLATVTAGGRAEDVTSAQAALASAQARLNQLMNPSPVDLQNAQTALEKARSDLAAAQARLETAKQPYTQPDWIKAEGDVNAASAVLKNAEVKLNQVKGGYTLADIQSQQASVASAKTSLIAAQDKYEQAKNDLSAAAGSTGNSVSYYAQQAQDKQAAYDAALQKLNQMLAGYTATEIQSAQKDYDSALASYNSAVAKLEQMKQGPTAQDLQQHQTTLDKARADLAAAETRLAQLQSPTENDLTVSRASVIQATQSLAKAKQPYTAQDVQTAQAAVDVANVNLATAKASLADATIKAPFDGIITQRNLAPGSIVSSSSPVVTLVSSDLEITVNIEENRLSQLKANLPATISTPAYPGQSYTGKVVNISPAADVRSHTFPMKVVPDNNGGKLKAGMYVELKITAEERTGVLIPRDAIIQRSGKEVVFVVVEGKAQMREVIQGIPQGDQVEIISGVASGEQVVVVGNNGLNNGDSVRISGSQGSDQQQQTPQQQQPQKQQQQQQQPQKQQQQNPGAPTKTGQ